MGLFCQEKIFGKIIEKMLDKRPLLVIIIPVAEVNTSKTTGA